MNRNMKISIFVAWSFYAFLGIAPLVFAVMVSGCAKQSVMDKPVLSPPATVVAPGPAQADEQAISPDAVSTGPMAFRSPAFFDFDKDALRMDAEKALDDLYRFMTENAALEVRIEGNCDERGTAEYNQDLGLRRAKQAKRYLIDRGIHPLKISVVSYGKERLVCIDDTEQCHQMNRRADFILR